MKTPLRICGFWLLTVFELLTCSIEKDVHAQTVNSPFAGSASALNVVSNNPSNTGPVVIDNALLVYSSGGTTYNDATVAITSGGISTDVLGYTGTLPTGVSASYNSATQLLTFTGTATGTDYQALLRTVTINSSAAGGTQKTVSFEFNNSMLNNGHYYEVVPASLNYFSAKSAAASRTLFGLQGYLTAITSAPENTFVINRNGANYSWIGASDDYNEINTATGTTTYANQTASEGHWYWVTGPDKATNFSFGSTTISGQYSYWGSGQPDNTATIEHYGSMSNSGTWNDLPSNGYSTAYITEYGGTAGDPTVTPTFNRTVNYTCNRAIALSGGSPLSSISDGSTTTAAANGTDFGSGTFSRSYTISNLSSCPLTISSIALSGTNAADYSIASGAPTSVAASSSATFTVNFSPSATGVRTATVTINNNSSADPAYSFAIQGTSLAGPAGINNGVLAWLDASDPDADANAANNPTNGASLLTWKDKSGNAKDATKLSTQNAGLYNSGSSSLINGHPVVSFAGSNVYEFAGIDIRAVSNPEVSIIAVYKQGNSSTTGLWGDDNTNWDRFMYTAFGSQNGIASQGPVSPVSVSIPNSGIPGHTYLFTAIYKGQVSGGVNNGPANGSSFYFNGSLLGTFTDHTDATNAQTDLRLGWDGDDGNFTGDVAEFIVYNRSLSACEIQQINGYLSTKYGITFSTAAISAGGATTFCQGGTVTLTASSGTAYQWYLNGSPISGATNQTYSANQSGNYTVDVTTACGTATSAATTVTVNPLPSASLTGTTSICSGSNTILSFSGTPNAVVSYSNGSTSSNITLNGSGLGSMTVSPANTTTYTATSVVSAAPASCAGTASGSAVVTVNTAPAFTSCTGNQSANTASNTCNAAVTYSTLPVVSGTPTPTLTYTFTGATVASGSGTGSGATFNKGITNVTVTASNTCSPAATCTFTVTVTDNQAPVIGTQSPTPVPAAILANVPEAAQYRTVYQLNIPNSANYNNTAVPYTVDNTPALSGATFSRVAYYMELVSGTTTKWVWVSMDKFNGGILPSELGIPINSVFQQNVTNMNVLSSSNSGITNGNGITTGNIEFWPQCYSAASSASSPASASSAVYDFGDTRAVGTKCYGSFQVHNYWAGQTLFAYNRWMGSGNSDLGIGTSPGPYTSTNNPDWTFNQNAGTYSTKKLYVFIDGGLQAISANTDAGQCSATVAIATPAATDNCGTPTVSGVRSDSQPISSTYPKGTTTIIWTATDGTLSTTATQTVTVTDNQSPVVACPSNVSLSTISNTCAADYTILDPISDNCTSATWSAAFSGNALGNPSDLSGIADGTNSSAISFNRGITTITLSGTDGSNAANTCSFTVTVTDNQNPTITAPSTVTVPGYCQNVPASAVTLGTPTGLSDNCASLATLSANVSNNAPASYPVGNTTVVWTVSDGNGNSATSNQTVTVVPGVITATAAVTNPLNGTAYPMSGQEIQTIYLNYPSSAQSETMNVTGSGGTGTSFSYAWTRSSCNGNSTTMAQLYSSGANPAPVTSNSYTWAPTSSDICLNNGNNDNVYIFACTVTDNHGCSTAIPATKKLNVVDPYVTGGNVQICHKVAVRGGSSTQILQVAPSTVSTHLAHGDYLGNCAVFTGVKLVLPEASEEQNVTVYPNPTTGVFILELSSIKEGASIMITDVAGKLIANKSIAKDAAPTATFDLSNLAKGMYLIQVRDGDLNYRTKIVVQ